MGRRVQEEVTGVVPGKYYYRGRYWSELYWSKLNSLDGAPDTTSSPGEGFNSAVEPEAMPHVDRRHAPEPAAVASR